MKNIENIEELKCNNCWEIIATPCIYEKENRKAFKIYQDAITKKVRKIEGVINKKYSKN